MTHIEIYGPRKGSAAAKTKDAETFCSRMAYPCIVRDTWNDPQARVELLQRLNGRVALRPAIFIGDVHVGSFRELMEMEPFTVQQMIGE